MVRLSPTITSTGRCARCFWFFSASASPAIFCGLLLVVLQVVVCSSSSSTSFCLSSSSSSSPCSSCLHRLFPSSSFSSIQFTLLFLLLLLLLAPSRNGQGTLAVGGLGEGSGGLDLFAGDIGSGLCWSKWLGSAFNGGVRRPVYDTPKVLTFKRMPCLDECRAQKSDRPLITSALFVCSE